MRTSQKDNVFFTAQESNAWSSLRLNVSDFRHCILSVSGIASYVGTTFIAGAIGATPPTFSNARTSTNAWDYVQVVDLQDGSAIDGDTGIEFRGASANDVRQYEVNINAVDWISVLATSFTAGSVTIVATLSND